MFRTPSRTSSSRNILPPDVPQQRSLIRKYRESDAWLWTEVAAVVVGLAFFIPTAVALWFDLADRKTQRISQAWDAVTRVAPGNSGKGPALEYLNHQGIPLVGINLSAESNQGPIYLHAVNLSEAVLQSANFSDADLESANLSGANLWKADLSGANLSHANLQKAILRHAELSDTNLWDANLSQTNFWKADLSDANLWEANLSGANLRIANLSGTYLWKADLSSADLSGANLSKAILRNANLSDANLSRANLSETDLWHVDLSGANLKSASNLSQTELVTACGNEKTILPKGLTINACVKK